MIVYCDCTDCKYCGLVSCEADRINLDYHGTCMDFTPKPNEESEEDTD